VIHLYTGRKRNMKKKHEIVTLRTIRKASHITNKIVRRGSHFLDKVEDKSTRLIINKTGSPDGQSSVDIKELTYHTFPEITPIHPALPAIGQRPSVTVFAFLDPRGFYGGIATLLCVGAALANELGYDFRVAQTTGFSNNTDVLDFLRSKGIVIEEERFSTVDLSRRSITNFGYLPLHQEDVLVVSAWWDAHTAAQLPLKNKFVYLIQDYEPIFYNNSDRSVFAEQTYHSDKFIPILNTEVLYNFFKANSYKYIEKNGVWFEPAPAPIVKKGKLSVIQKNKRTLFLYARPNVHRNLFYNALIALDIALQDERMHIFDWSLYSAGSADVPSVKLTSGHVIKNKGKMDMQDYYNFASTVDVAVSPMLAPHPNYPTLELASLGAAVVSTKWETKQDLKFYSPNILMAEPTAESMAQKIIEAALMTNISKRNNLSKNRIGSDWSAALVASISEIASRYTK
jgi:hypothetical protein